MSSAFESRYFPLIDNPAGLAFSQCTSRFQVVAAGRRSGKTERTKRKVVRRVFANTGFSPARYALCAPTREQAKDLYWSDMKAMLPAMLVRDISESKLCITLINDAEVYVVGLDKPQRIEGPPWDGFVFDETDDIKRDAWAEHIFPCFIDRKAWAIFLGVPNGLEKLYEFSKYASTDTDWSFFTWPSAEVMDPAEIARFKSVMDERSFKQEFEASFETPGGLVYYAFSDANITSGTRIEDADSVGLDFNVVPYMPGVVFYRRGDEMVVVDEINVKDGNTPAVIHEIQARYGNRVKNAYPDPTGRKRSTSAVAGTSDFTMLKEAGMQVYAHPRTESVKDRIASTNSMFCSMSGVRRLFIDERCKMLIDSLRRHSYKRGTSIPDTDQHVHRLDALCYPTDYLFPLKRAHNWQQ